MPAVPQARPRARVSGLCGLDPAPPARLAPFGRRARSAADCLLSKIPCLTARSRDCLFSKCLIRPPGRGLDSFQSSLSDRPAAGLLIFKKLYMTATQQNQKMHRSRMRTSPPASFLKHVRAPGSPALRLRPCAACAARAPCGRRARSAADCLLSKILYLTALPRDYLFSKLH